MVLACRSHRDRPEPSRTSQTRPPQHPTRPQTRRPDEKITGVRVLSTETIDQNVGLRQSEGFVCEGRMCRVQVQDSLEPRLLNSPLLGPRPDLAEIGLGEVFQIEGQPGEFKTERLVGDANALMIERVS